MLNIKFWYSYRDSCNYKKHGHVVFANPENLDLKTIEASILAQLIGGEWFYHYEWKLPDLRFENLDIDNDPTWHEFDCVEFTDEEVTHLLPTNIKLPF